MSAFHPKQSSAYQSVDHLRQRHIPLGHSADIVTGHAEVTAGGIATDQLSQKTMESTRLPGLYAIGEAVDVTGWLGGYNFQWAWASARAAGEAV